MGFTAGQARNETSYEIDGSTVVGALLDSNPNGLTRRVVNTDVPGRMVFRVRNGVIIDGTAPRPNNVVHAASFDTALTPNAFFTVFGESFTTSTLTWDSAIPDGRTLPRELGGVRVRINNQEAYLSFVSPGQLNVLAPPGSYSGSVPVQITTDNGTASRQATVNPVAPGFFGYKLGERTYAAALFANSTVYVAAEGALGGVQSRPAKADDILSLYATGLGATTPAVPAGQVLTQAYPIDSLARVVVTIDGVPAEMLYAGMTFAGVFQINIRVPRGLRAGDLPIVLEVDRTRAPQQAFITCAN